MPLKDKKARLEYQRKWLAARRKSYFEDKVCASCGNKKNLELDHIDRTTKVDHRIWSWSKERREHELSKCQALCESCHAKKSASEYSNLFKYKDYGVCKNNHELSLVKFYEDSVGRHCSYCHHIATTRRRGHKTKTLEEWIEFKSKQ